MQVNYESWMNSICCVEVMSLIVTLKLHSSCSYIIAIKLHKIYNSIYDELSLLQLMWLAQ
jgi:hypothetical protein